MRRSLWFILTLVALLVAACGDLTASAPATIETLGFDGATQVAGAAFLPPVGRAVDTSGFDAGASVEIRIVVDGGVDDGLVLDSTFRTDEGSIVVRERAYTALWHVADTVSTYSDVHRVRVEVLVNGPYDGLALAAACDGEDSCLAGSFDARIRRSRAGRPEAGVLDLTRVQTLPIRFFLAGAAPDRTLEPTSLSELRRLAAPNDYFEDTGPNCAVHEFNMPGQGLNALGSGLNALGSGLNALGSVGGMFLFAPGETSGAPDIRILEPREAGELAEELVRSEFQGPLVRNAAILVVDDFGGVYDLDPGLLSPPNNLNENRLRRLIEGSGFSHGALVMLQTVQMVEEAGFAEDTSRPWSGSDFRVFSRTEVVPPEEDAGDPYEYTVHLVVAAVDTNGLDTDVIPERIQNALNALLYYDSLAAGFDIMQVAINMSFVLVPCSVLEDFDASDLEDFEAYREALGADNGVAEDFRVQLNLTRLLMTPLDVDNDPLLLQIECQYDGEYYDQLDFVDDGEQGDEVGNDESYYPWAFYVETPDYEGPTWGCGEGSTVYVGSSGNFGLDYAMYPAAWPEVLSVGSQDAQDGTGTSPDDGFSNVKSGFSNDAEVMAPGALYLLGQSSTGNRALAYAGTSFSAPVASLFTALDQMAALPACALPTSSRLTGADDRANEPLGDAMTAYCWQFD